MSDSAKEIIEKALQLPSSERAIVAEQILLSLERPDPQVDSSWAAEAEQRISAYQQGAIDALPASDVLGKYADD